MKMKNLQGFVLAFAYFQMITAVTLPDSADLKLKGWCAEFGTVKDDDQLQEIALSKFQELTGPHDVDSGICTNKPKALFVIELDTDPLHENGINTQLPHAVKNGIIVVFRLQSELNVKEPLYFFVNLIPWEKMDWCLIYVSHWNTKNSTKVKIRYYSGFRHYNYFTTPWERVEHTRVQNYCCTFHVGITTIKYSILGHNKASAGLLTLLVTTAPANPHPAVDFHSHADLYEHVCKDIQERVNESLFQPEANLPRSDVNFCKAGYSLTKQVSWKNDSYWFLQYESADIMFIKAVEVRTVFDEPVICSTWCSGNIELAKLSYIRKTFAFSTQSRVYVNNKNVFLGEIITDESRRLIEGASLKWEVDEEETLRLIYVLPVEFKKSTQKDGRISNYVAIHVIHDNDQNPVKYHYAVGSINLQGQFQCEYKTKEGIRNIEEVWKQIQFHYDHLLRPRYLQLERVFKSWQEKFSEEHKPQKFSWTGITETAAHHIVFGRFELVYGFAWVALQLEECNEGYAQIGFSGAPPPERFDVTVNNLVKWKYPAPESVTTQFKSGRFDSESGRVYAMYSVQVGGSTWYTGVLGMLSETEKDGEMLRDNSNWTLLYITQETKSNDDFEVLLEYEVNMGSSKPRLEDWFTPVQDSGPLKILEGVQGKILSELRGKLESDNLPDGLELSIVLRQVQRQSTDGNNFLFLCGLFYGKVSYGYFFVVFGPTQSAPSETLELSYAMKGVSRLSADIVKATQRAQVYADRHLKF